MSCALQLGGKPILRADLRSCTNGAHSRQLATREVSPPLALALWTIRIRDIEFDLADMWTDRWRHAYHGGRETPR